MLEIYKASVENVKELKRNRKKINQLVNQSIRNKSTDYIITLTKTYSLVYSAFAETCFLKMIHTPNGFSDDLIRQIMTQRNLAEKWNKCLNLAFRKISNMENAGEVQNKRQILERLIEKYIIEPSQLRNKIAHGQWKVALNSENTATNLETTNKINTIDFVQVDILFQVYEKISQAVEDLIESPHKAHFRDFYFHLTELNVLVESTNEWTMDSKIKVITEKMKRQKSRSQKLDKA
tara:strand:+ start:930 stop:1634 length:705 start_codon:yes stop_codon:yes gene_type:complete